MNLSKHQIDSFRAFIWNFYYENKRDFAWRNIDDPYAILVSEIMLQQTQTYRVAPKFDLWLSEFADFATLAQAPLRDVLTIWQGLGYSRRAIALHTIAQRVVAEFNGTLPNDPEILQTFKGVGPNTAGSICAFAFNKPTAFIETNIRAVYIHTFFKNQDKVTDKQLHILVEQTVDATNAREWYYALMDYGVYLKQLHKNPSRKSAHHNKQSKFEGSHRQIRGNILKLITKFGLLTKTEIVTNLNKENLAVENALLELCQEGFLKVSQDEYSVV